MNYPPTAIDFDRLLKLRLLVARFGEMDAARWWNTGDQARGTALLGRAGGVLMSRGFARTHRFAQARVVFAVARARCAEVFDPPGCMTLWSLPASIEDQFDARWPSWLEQRDAWAGFFTAIEPAPSDLHTAMRTHGLLTEAQAYAASRLRRSAEMRSVPLPGTHAVNDDTFTLLAAGFSRGEHAKLAVPYARVED
jgi:hypothetical protein